MRRTDARRGAGMMSSGLLSSVIPGRCAAWNLESRDSGLTPAGAPRNDGVCGLLPHPLRRALLRKCLWSLDIVLRGRHRLHGGIVALLGNGLLERTRHAFLDRLLGGADRHRRVLGNGLGPAHRASQRFALRHHFIDEAELKTLLGADVT